MNTIEILKNRLLGVIGIIIILISPWLPWYTLTTKYLSHNFSLYVTKSGNFDNNGGIIFGLNLLLCVFALVDIIKKRYKSELLLGVIALFFAIMSIYDLSSWKEYFSVEYALGTEAFKNSSVILGIGVFLHISGAIVLLLDYSMAKKGKNLIETNINTTNKSSGNLDELMKYKQLLDSGAISQEEFDKKKKELL